MSYTLVVVDMQKFFLSPSQQRVRRHCKKAVLQAMKDNAPIVFVEYRSYGKTISLLADPVRDAQYKKLYVTYKSTDDGSRSVSNLVKRHGLSKNLKVVGVNTNACVYSTVRGMQGKLPKTKIQVISKACDAIGGTMSHVDGLNWMKQLSYVKIK